MLLVTLWQFNITMDNRHRNSWFSYDKWWFSTAMLVYQRVHNVDHIYPIPVIFPFRSVIFGLRLGHVQRIRHGIRRRLLPRFDDDVPGTLEWHGAMGCHFPHGNGENMEQVQLKMDDFTDAVRLKDLFWGKVKARRIIWMGKPCLLGRNSSPAFIQQERWLWT